MHRPGVARPASAALRKATSSRPLVLPRAAVGRGAVGRAGFGSVVTGALAVGAAAAGAFAVGALAIGALSVGRLAVRRAAAEAVRLGRVEIDELVVHSYLGPGATTSPQPGEAGPARGDQPPHPRTWPPTDHALITHYSVRAAGGPGG